MRATKTIVFAVASMSALVGGFSIWESRRSASEQAARARLEAQVADAREAAERAERATEAVERSLAAARPARVERRADSPTTPAPEYHQSATTLGSDSPWPPPASAGDPAESFRRASEYIGKLTKIADGETRDASWASAAESSIRSSSDALAQTKVLDVSCRTTMCTWDAHHADPGALDQWLRGLSSAMPDLPRRMTLRKIESDGSITTTTVAMRDGHDFPLAPQ